MKFFSQDLLMSVISTGGLMVRYSIDAYYLDEQGREATDGITVTLVADGYTQEGNHIDVPVGTDVSYTVLKSAYDTVGPEHVTVVGDTTQRVKMNALPMWEYTIIPTPADATVTMSAGGVYQSSTGTISVPQGSEVAWDIGRSNMNPLHGTRLVPASSGDENPIVETKELTATITLAGVTPSDAVVTWETGTGDNASGMSATAFVSHQVSLSVTRDGYSPYSRTFPEAGATYLTNTTIPAIALTKKPLTCSLSATPNDAVIHMSVNSGEEETDTGTLTVDCVMGDIITWRVTRNGYTEQSGTYTMGTTNAVLPAVTLSPTTKSVTISSIPSGATITIQEGSTVIASGTGLVRTDVEYGRTITYTVSYADVTQSDTVTITDIFTTQVVLNASGSETEVITTDASRVLPKGNYVAVLIGSASAGGAGYGGSVVKPTSGGTRCAVGGASGPGGGTGYVSKVYFTANGTDNYYFHVGLGGSRQTQTARGAVSGTTFRTVNTNTPATGDTALNGDSSQIFVNGTLAFSAGGGTTAIKANTYVDALVQMVVGQGGCCGGIVGYGAYQADGQSLIAGDDGQGGTKSGGDAVRTITPKAPGSSSQTVTVTGSAGTQKTYDTNYNSFSSTTTLPGLGGKGCYRILSSVNTATKLDNATEQFFLDNMSGGGSGTGGPANFANTQKFNGGPGGGGGAWTDGEDGFCVNGATIPSSSNPWYSGKGGDGVILLACLAWS